MSIYRDIGRLSAAIDNESDAAKIAERYREAVQEAESHSESMRGRLHVLMGKFMDANKDKAFRLIVDDDKTRGGITVTLNYTSLRYASFIVTPGVGISVNYVAIRDVRYLSTVDRITLWFVTEGDADG